MPKARHLALALVATLLLALPASAAVKAPGKSVDRLAALACAKERQKIGEAAFRKKYGERGTTRACVRRGRSKVRAAQRDASSKCLAELAEIGPLEFAEDYGTDETGSDALEQCMDETAELALDPGDDYSEEDERSRGASQDLSQPFHDSCRRCHKWLIRLVVVENSFRLEAPRPSTHPVDVGLRTEAAILAELVRRGYQVLVPFGTNQRYDLVLDLDGRFVRAQCKTGRLRRGVVVFNTTSVRSNRRGWFIRGYEGEAEIFLVYCADTDRIYAVPVEDAPAGSGCLRVDPARNGQVDGIRWARDYELPA